MKSLKIVNKRKFIKSIAILIGIMGIIICTFSNRSYSNVEQKYKTEYVVKGETLWSIAQQEIKENPYFKDEDIRNVILEIKQANHMTTSDITEGIELKIPIY